MSVSKAGPGIAMAYFEAHLDDQTDECFPWPYGKANGYGIIYTEGERGQPKSRCGVHALACERVHGPRPPGMQAIHGPCKLGKECWNPRHVQWGTRRQNQLDRHRDGVPWPTRGERSPFARLTDAKVAEILNLWVEGSATQAGLAAEYGVQQNTINCIVNGKTWSHIPRPAGAEWRQGEPIRNRAKLTESDVQAILTSVANGTATQSELARTYNVNQNTINGIVNGRTWTQVPRPPRSDGQEWLRGERIRTRASLTTDQVAEIRGRYAAGERQPRALAAEFGVHRETIRVIVAGGTWKTPVTAV